MIDDYLFENEFNHILTLDIIQIIRTMEDKLSKSEIDLIEFTLSFLSLLPLYTKTAFIKLFLDLVFEGYYQLFDADWANNCISAVINFAFVSIPLMEECHYMLLKKNGAISCDLSMLNEKYKLNLEHIEDLKPTNPIVPLEIYSRIQNYISLIKTVFGDDIYDSVIKIKEYKTEIDIPDDNGNTRSIEVPEIGINSYSIINSVFSILNGNLNNYIDESYSASNSEKAFFRKRLEANEALSNLYRRHIIEKF